MNRWTPLFSKIVDSSLWSEPDHVCKVFITMLALKDYDHVVRYNAYGIGSRCWPGTKDFEKKALEALKILSEPDKNRIEPQPNDGRRIEKVTDGWRILNGAVYEEMMRKLNNRIYKTTKQREYRANKPLSGEGAALKAEAIGDTETYDKIAAGEFKEQSPACHT